MRSSNVLAVPPAQKRVGELMKQIGAACAPSRSIEEHRDEVLAEASQGFGDSTFVLDTEDRRPCAR